MNHLHRVTRFVVFASLAMTMVFSLSNFGAAAAWGKSGIPLPTRTSTDLAYPCNTKQPSQTQAHQDLASLASNTICNMVAGASAKARTLFAGNSGLEYLPWAPMLVVLVLVCFLVLGGWCSWKMRGFRPRRKYNIGRVI